MVKSDKNNDVSCMSRMACLFICHVVKQCRSDDNSLGENVVIKPHLEPLDLQGGVSVKRGLGVGVEVSFFNNVLFL